MNETRAPSPEHRAEFLYKHMQTMNPKPTMWDLVCFSTETIALLAGELEFLQPVAKQLVSVVYTAHYHSDIPFDSCLSNSNSVEKTSTQEPSELTIEKSSESSLL